MVSVTDNHTNLWRYGALSPLADEARRSTNLGLYFCIIIIFVTNRIFGCSHERLVIFIYVLCSNRLIATSATPRSAGTLRQWRSRLALFAFRTRAYRAFLSLNVLALVLRLYRVVALPRVNDFDESARRASIPSPFLTLRTHSRVLCCFMYINYFIVVRL